MKGGDTKLSKQEQIEELTELIGELFEVVDILSVNFKVNGQPGHPFMIGAAHVAHASQHHGGLITGLAIDASGVGCRYHDRGPNSPFCNLPWKAHTCDTVVFLKLKRNLANKEAAECLFKAKNFLLEQELDGATFIENGFRIAPPEPEPNEPEPSHSG